MKISRKTLRYAAGLLDAKATIGYYLITQGHRYRIDLVVTGKNQALAELLRDIFQVGTIQRQGATWRWKCHSAQARQVLKLVAPFLVLQRKRVQLLLEFGDGNAQDTLARVLREGKE